MPRNPQTTLDLPRWNYPRRISRREANRALYFDFEGRMNEAPALVGVYAGGWFRHFVFDAAFVPLVKSSRDAGERVFRRRRFAEAIEQVLLGPAETEDRRLIAFSEHELRVIHIAAGPGLAERVARRYLNARDFVAAWVSRDRRELREKLESNALAELAAACNYEWPGEYDLQPADAIRRLREQLARAATTGKSIDRRATELWARLLGYNRHDCLATKHVVRCALRRGIRRG